MSKLIYFGSISITLMLLLSSCSVFWSSRKLDMAPFSENAGILFGEAAKISRPFKWQHLKAYLDVPEALQLHRKSIPVIKAMSGIVYYSHQVVAINDAPLRNKEKNRQLARYLAEVLNEAGKEGRLDSLGLSKETLQQALTRIPRAESYLDAIAEAGPVVNSVVLSIQTRLDGLQEDINALIAAFDRRIETDFDITRKNFLELKELQAQTMGTTKLLYRMLMGEQVDLDTLLSRDNSLKKYFSSSQIYTSAELEVAEQYLLERLRNIDEVFKQLTGDIAEYHAKQDEIEEWRLNIDEKMRIARNAISVWAQSHRNLGAGIPVPPLVNISGIATGVVDRTVGKVIP